MHSLTSRVERMEQRATSKVVGYVIYVGDKDEPLRLLNQDKEWITVTPEELERMVDIGTDEEPHEH